MPDMMPMSLAAAAVPLQAKSLKMTSVFLKEENFFLQDGIRKSRDTPNRVQQINGDHYLTRID